jgi:VanZ family protein
MRRIVWYGAWLSACGLAMLTPGTAFPDVSVVSFQDKIIHFIIFFVLAYLGTGMGIHKKVEIWKKKRLWINFMLLAFLPSIGLETAQHLIPNRSFDLNDLAINVLGVILGLFGYLYRPSCKFILD